MKGLFASVLLGTTLAAGAARAQDAARTQDTATEPPFTPEPATVPPSPPPPPTPVVEGEAPAPPPAADSQSTSQLPTRFGVVPTIGTGFAKLSSTQVFPGFIGLTTLGGEVHLEAPPYGVFARFEFHSSGLDGRWTAPSFALGGSYRLFGDGVDRLALLARGGLIWERWHATNGNCPVDFFFPSNCKALVEPAPTGVLLNNPPIVTVTGDLVGIMAGARLEMPIPWFYLALDGELAGMFDITDSTPGNVFSARIAMVIAFRDLRKKPEAPKGTPRNYRRY